ncbi:MAG: HU family DNA-binding protein [Bacteroidetes bacterium]|nr:HU family DNA-binding protein [Bacteroidota bacterium]MBU2508229.1 HU family DNA-binding protein [Bacteroidota bacterium]
MNEKISYHELVNIIAAETGASKELIEQLLTETVSLTREGLERDGNVHLSGFGHFKLRWNKPRVGRNPQTGEELEIPGRYLVNFRAEAKLRDFINRKYAHLKPRLIEEEPAQESFIEPDPKVSVIPEIIPKKEKIIVTKEEKKSSRKWGWILVPLILILLFFFFFPLNTGDDLEISKSKVSEETTNESELGKDQDAGISEDQISESIEAESEAAEVTGIPGGTHTVASGDVLWSISEKYYQQGNLWPNIYRVNMSNIADPDSLTLGSKIIIPPLQGEMGNLSKADLKDISEGFGEAYLIYKKFGSEKALNYLWVLIKLKVNEAINTYSDRVDKRDLELVRLMKGAPLIK